VLPAANANATFFDARISGKLKGAMPPTTPNGRRITIAAGHPEFKGRYVAGLEETRRFGKRPDLLLFPSDAAIEADVSERSQAQTDSLVKEAVAAIEVRSSKYDALTYISVRKQQRASGKSTGRETPSFTVKVEDLVIVYR
jgi:hypothetical protein